MPGRINTDIERTTRPIQRDPLRSKLLNVAIRKRQIFDCCGETPETDLKLSNGRGQLHRENRSSHLAPIKRHADDEIGQGLGNLVRLFSIGPALPGSETRSGQYVFTQWVERANALTPFLPEKEDATKLEAAGLLPMILLNLLTPILILVNDELTPLVLSTRVKAGSIEVSERRKLAIQVTGANQAVEFMASVCEMIVR